ncbi:probable transcription factor At1g11510 [Cajanus cajan]|uniref:Glabrous enhancer-binding protein-like DBD domain-containing protein n=1 Tax=Cajanus cajan TaxID=3821 RepID=A0A151RLQ1_CAJCA|nr:probable transcription factor At1g11510 [Cajanus cajan]KYP43504.1 hypothetical protein KK1_035071 [Cajanus cajan]
MAPKMKLQPRNPPVEDPPTASSSSSSEYEEEEEDLQPSTQPPAQDFSSSSSEDDEEPSKTPPTNPTSKPSSSESDTPSDSDSEPKPKPTNQAQKPKPQPQSSSAPPKSGSKRPAEYSALPKPAKKKPTDASPSVAASDDEAEEDGKKSGGGGGGQLKLFQRLWSEEDELAILKGMAEFISRTGQDPHRYPESFHDTVKKSLHVEASSNQLKEKIRRLKKKFETNLGRGKNGEDPKFSKPHDQTLFDLSKKVWGEASMLVVRPKFNGKPAKSPIPKKEGKSRNVTTTTPETNTQLALVDSKGSEKSDIGDVNSLYREISDVKELDEDEMKRGLTLIGESKRKELEGRWRNLRRAEIELVANRSLLIGEQIKLIHEALESSDK